MKPETREATRWYALLDTGTIVQLPSMYVSFNDAEAHTPGNTVWLVDEDTAREWRNKLDRYLGDDGYPTALKYAPMGENA
jgi:hypothetical protein